MAESAGNTGSNMDYQDFNQDQVNVAQQRKLAEYLRGMAARAQQPEGQMVGGQYIRPHFLQMLNPVMQQAQAGYQEGQANQAEQAMQGRIGQAQQQWRSSLPQTIAARSAVMGPEQQGNNPSAYAPPQKISPAVPEQIPGRDATLAATMQGMAIPGNERAAMTYNAGMTGLQDREDKQKEMQALQTERLVQQHQKLLSDERMKQETLRTELLRHGQDAAARHETAKMIRESIERVERANNDAAQHSRGAGADLARERFQETKDQNLAHSLQKLGDDAKLYAPLVPTAQSVQDMLDKYPAGKTPGLGYAGLLSPFALKQQANVNQGTIQRFLAITSRAEIGLSQTLSEKAQQAMTNLANGKYNEKEFRAAWPEILEKTNSYLKNLEAAYGPDVVKKYNEQGGDLRTVKSRVQNALPLSNPPPGTPPASAPAASAPGVLKITGDAEYNQLPKGARYAGPDGVVRTK